VGGSAILGAAKNTRTAKHYGRKSNLRFGKKGAGLGGEKKHLQKRLRGREKCGSALAYQGSGLG